MKKFVALILSVLMVLTMFSALAEEKPLIVIITPSHANPYFKTVADAAAALAEIAKVTGYKVEDGKLVLEMPAFTPEADPEDKPVTPAPTGDMTVALVAVAVVSLAAVTVIAKKKVTE